jgi:hypothetical protein
MQQKEQIMHRIKMIKSEVDMLAEKDQQQRLSSNIIPTMNAPVMNEPAQSGQFVQKAAVLDTEAFLCELKRNINELQT